MPALEQQQKSLETWTATCKGMALSIAVFAIPGKPYYAHWSVCDQPPLHGVVDLPLVAGKELAPELRERVVRALLRVGAAAIGKALQLPLAVVDGISWRPGDQA